MKLLYAFRRHLMFGLAVTVPVIAVGSFFIALNALVFDARLVTELSGIAMLVQKLSENTFTMVTTVLSAAIAYSVAGRYAIIPGMIGGLLADSISIDANGIDINFIGGIFSGFISGYIVRKLDKRILNSQFAVIKHVIVLPLFSTLVTGFIMYYIVGDPTAYFVAAVKYIYTAAPFAVKILVSVLAGMLIASDMGGPVSKFVFLTVAVLVVQFHVYAAMGPVAAALSVPPLALGISAMLGSGISDALADRRTAGKFSVIAALLGLPEGALVFLTSDTARVITATCAGAGLAAGIAAWCGVSVAVPFGGLIVLPFVNKLSGFGIALCCGTICALLLLRQK